MVFDILTFCLNNFEYSKYNNLDSSLNPICFQSNLDSFSVQKIKKGGMVIGKFVLTVTRGKRQISRGGYFGG